MKTLALLIVGIAGILTAAAAPAATLYFNYTTPNDSGGSARWTQSSTPTVDGYYSGSYTTVSVTNGYETYPDSKASTFTEVYFPSGGADGGFNTLLDQISPNGPQLYAGAESAPTFAPGSFSLDGGTLTVSTAPEPAAWSILMLGVAGLGGVLRARRGRVFASI